MQFCAFDILAEGGNDLRKLPLHLRKRNLERLLARRPEGIFVNPFERGEIGPDLFRAACRMGLEGLVSKHRERAYRRRLLSAPMVRTRIELPFASECALVPRDIRGTAIDPHRFVAHSRALVRRAFRAPRWGGNFAADRGGKIMANQTTGVGRCGKSLRSERHG